MWFVCFGLGYLDVAFVDYFDCFWQFVVLENDCCYVAVACNSVVYSMVLGIDCLVWCLRLIELFMV